MDTPQTLYRTQTTTGQSNFNDKGFIVEADSPIYVSARLNAGGSRGSNAPQAGALVSKGENALGTTYSELEHIRVIQVIVEPIIRVLIMKFFLIYGN